MGSFAEVRGVWDDLGSSLGSGVDSGIGNWEGGSGQRRGLRWKPASVAGDALSAH